MIESELKLAQMTRNLENHNRTTAYERSEINGYLNGKKRVPQTLHSASELVHIHRQEHSKALGTIIHKSHNIENTNLSSTVLSTLLLASIHIYYVGCGNTGMFCRSTPLFCYTNRKTCHINCIMLFVLCVVSSGSTVFAYSAIVVFGADMRMCLMQLLDGPCAHFISLFYRN